MTVTTTPNGTEELHARFAQARPAPDWIAELRERIANSKLEDKSLAFNTARVEALELDNLLEVAEATAIAAEGRKESRGAHSRYDFPDRDDENWMKHTLAWLGDDGKVTIDYRPVHNYTLSDDIDYIKPKARVY